MILILNDFWSKLHYNCYGPYIWVESVDEYIVCRNKYVVQCRWRVLNEAFGESAFPLVQAMIVGVDVPVGCGSHSFYI
jgi:hypothetical protein